MIANEAASAAAAMRSRATVQAGSLAEAAAQAKALVLAAGTGTGTLPAAVRMAATVQAAADAAAARPALAAARVALAVTDAVAHLAMTVSAFNLALEHETAAVAEALHDVTVETASPRRPEDLCGSSAGIVVWGPGPHIDAETPQQVQAGAPAISGMPLRILRSEGLVLLAAALAGYFVGLDEPWWLACRLLPFVARCLHGRLREICQGGGDDVQLRPLLSGAGAAGRCLASVAGEPLWQAVALVWFAHIGMDRALGYGLKYETDFRDTHLGRIGR